MKHKERQSKMSAPKARQGANVKVQWGRFKLEMPVEIILFLLINGTSLLFHNVNV